jgi:hypothetical protein
VLELVEARDGFVKVVFHEVRFDLELAVLASLAGLNQDCAEFGALASQHICGRMADHPAALEIEVELLLGHLEDAWPWLAEHAFLLEAAIAFGVVGAGVDLRNWNLLVVHALQECFAELGELTLTILAERDVLPGGRYEQFELRGIDAAQGFDGPVDKRNSAFLGEASLLDDHAVEFEEEALLVRYFCHVGGGGQRCGMGGPTGLSKTSAVSGLCLKYRQ